MHVRYPVGIRALDRGAAGSFALLFAIESLARGLLATVIALQALALLESARSVSVLYALVGLSALLASFSIPWLVRRLGRRWTYTGGALALVAAAGAFAAVSLPGQVAGMALRVFGAACLSICTSLYILQYIQKHQLTRSEPLRLQASALAWTLGPTLGVLAYLHIGPGAAFAASAAAALVLLGVFWYLRLTEGTPIRASTAPPPAALRSVGRFFAVARLRRAWLITFGRSCWWVFLFVYTPLYMVQSGMGEVAGALVVSAANALLLLSPLFGRLASRFGIRAVVQVACLGCALATGACAFVLSTPAAVIVLLLVGALGCVALDAVGNIPFLRMVRARERAEMATVFRTYIDVSELAPPALFAVVLSFFGLEAVFALMGGGMLATALVAGGLPRRLGAETRPRTRRPARRLGELPADRALG